MDKDNNFTWNNPKINPPIAKDSDWYTYSIPVLCKVKYESGECYCVCTYNTYKNSRREAWEPETDCFEASTMPLADYNIEPAEGFEVLEWMLIPEITV